MIIALISVLSVSLIANIGLVFFIVFRKHDLHKKEPTYDVQRLLQDMATGPALLKIEYLDRADVLLRSPRHFS